MLGQVEGARGVAEAVALCRPRVIGTCAVSPCSHVVTALSAMAAAGEPAGCEYVHVESEFAALSSVMGAAGAGARVYTATAGQGLWRMVEALYDAAGLGLPIVMTVEHRAAGAPGDHGVALSQRDCGWLQLYAASEQEALDLHPQAFRIAEELSTPVMVCVDGFGRAEVPAQDDVDAFLPAPGQVTGLVSAHAPAGPEARYRAHLRQLDALTVIPDVADVFERRFGRAAGGLVRPYRVDDADTVVLALGSVLGPLRAAVDDLRADGIRIGAVGLVTYRPFPYDAVRAAVGDAARIVVLERAFSAGTGGIVTADVRGALADRRLHTVVAGLGGRPVTAASLRAVLARTGLAALTFLDLDTDLGDR